MRLLCKVIALLIVCCCQNTGGDAQTVVDTTTAVEIAEVTVSRTAMEIKAAASPMTSIVIGDSLLSHHSGMTLMHTLSQVAGVRSMDIGAGLSKPMIRGQGFARVAVAIDGIRQEGQQWGADHGLEIDANGVDEVRIVKGPSAIAYGPDAIGGVIEISSPRVLNQRTGVEGSVRTATLNGSVDGALSVSSGDRRRGISVRLSGRRYGDYRVPADTVVYMSVNLPIEHRRMDNTAGEEMGTSVYATYKKEAWTGTVLVTDVYSKSGFWTAAHGIPTLSKQTDNDHRDIGLPYQAVNHLRIQTSQKWVGESSVARLTAAFQSNHRREMSAFHTHYPSIEMPSSSDTEIELRLNTFDMKAEVSTYTEGTVMWLPTTLKAGFSATISHNAIGGYSFLMPSFRRGEAGIFGEVEWSQTGRLRFVAAARLDVGRVNIDGHYDKNVGAYLESKGYDEETVRAEAQTSKTVGREFQSVSFSVGVVAEPSHTLKLRANIGRAFRMPGANELAINGVHHGAFRHEKGDASLPTERGLQLDLSGEINVGRVQMTLSPFVGYYPSYIYLQPTSRWSHLPEAGQIWQYTASKVVMGGAEIDADIDLPAGLGLHIVGDKLINRNLDSKSALAYSPPEDLRCRLSYVRGGFHSFVEVNAVGRQTRVAPSEDKTDGYVLGGGGVAYSGTLGRVGYDIELTSTNLTDKKYYNHLSFYRRLEVPEAGRNIIMTLKVKIQ
ncbi:MAG: TonB-dependent receptor [Bacteroidales bacterium]|nr:TonB-dependent receptor [Bacteroidales bacterium]